VNVEPVLRRVDVDIDAELARVASSIDPAVIEPTEVEAYEIRLHSLHDAVTVMEEYEDGLDQA
jgi:hypothetical protein